MKKMPLLMSIILFIFTTISTSTVSAENNLNTECPGCNGEVPESTGSEELQNQVKDILFASDEFINLEKENTIDKDEIIVYADENSTKSIVHVPVNKAEGLLFSQYVIDHEKENIEVERNTYFEVSEDETVNLKVTSNDELAADITIEANNTNTITNNITGEKNSINEFLTSSSTDDDNLSIQPQSVCSTALTVILGAGSSVACHGLCTALGLVNWAGGITCNVICSVYNGIPLNQAINDICG